MSKCSKSNPYLINNGEEYRVYAVFPRGGNKVFGCMHTIWLGNLVSGPFFFFPPLLLSLSLSFWNDASHMLGQFGGFRPIHHCPAAVVM